MGRNNTLPINHRPTGYIRTIYYKKYKIWQRLFKQSMKSIIAYKKLIVKMQKMTANETLNLNNIE